MKERHLFILFIQYEKEVSLRAILRVNVSVKIVCNQLNQGHTTGTNYQQLHTLHCTHFTL